MTFDFDGIHFETTEMWVEGNRIVHYANGTPYRRKVYYNRTDGMYLVFTGYRLYYSDFN